MTLAAPWATAGSRLQVQLYVTHHPDELAGAVLTAFPDLASRSSALTWVAPALRTGFAEPRDKAFLHAIGCDELEDDLREFWPARGPVWDALAVGTGSAERSVVLVEAKSYAQEFYSAGSKAGETGSDRARASAEQIRHALTSTQRWLGLEADPERWMSPLDPRRARSSSLYQSANRLAHLHFLRDHGVDAWLVHILFVGDQTFRSTSRDEWEVALPAIDRGLGLTGPVEYAGHAFVESLDPAQFVSAPPT